MERDWSSWPQEYYSTTDRDERKKLLQERLESGTADEKDQIRMKFWELRYKTRAKMPVGVDYFIRSWMNLCFVARKPGNKFQLKQIWGLNWRQNMESREKRCSIRNFVTVCIFTCRSVRKMEDTAPS